MAGNVRIEGLDKVLGKLETLEQLRTVKAGIRWAAIHVKGKIAKYPERKYVAQPFVSARQRRWFFAALRAGDIDVPYKRGISPGSEALGRRWTIQTRDDGLTAVVGNNASYGPFVQDADSQAWFMAARGWKTVQQVADEETREVQEKVAIAIARALEK